MTIYGVALLAACALLGVFFGDLLGVALGVKTNVGGVGIAMVLLIIGRMWLERRNALNTNMKLGVEFWALMYIPIVVAMAAQQNVVAALAGGPLVFTAGLLTVGLSFAFVGLMGRIAPSSPPLPPEGEVLPGVHGEATQ